jgi:hypothetical protein
MPSPTVYQLKITLHGTRPPIWRRVLVPSEMTLQQLHRLIQDTMGWHDSHLHEFEISGEHYGTPNALDPFGDDHPMGSERSTKLSSVLGSKGAHARYEYDFGDGWTHHIVVEKILTPGEALAVPSCIGGRRKCPPEDCGGVGGYYNMLEALSDPEHEEHESLLEWAGGPIDPEDFSVEETNARLAPMRKTAKRKAAKTAG